MWVNSGDSWVYRVRNVVYELCVWAGEEEMVREWQLKVSLYKCLKQALELR